ncbi:MAG: TolC family protein [Terracidiphilus sp.]
MKSTIALIQNGVERLALGMTALLFRGAVALVGSLVLSGIVKGQELPSVSAPGLKLPPLPEIQHLKASPTAPYIDPGGIPTQLSEISAVAVHEGFVESAIPHRGRIITLKEAKETAAAAPNPMARLGQLQVEVAKQSRLGTLSTFFPQIGSTFDNLHFNKFMGQEIQVTRPIAGVTRTIGVPLLGKDSTLVAVNATQPITPLLALHQLYKIGVADERIAMAKAGMPVSAVAANVEKGYYQLLVAQQWLVLAKLRSRVIENKWLLASNSAMTAGSALDDEGMIEATREVAVKTSQVKELTASLNDILGWPPDTPLELVPPDPGYEDVNETEATERALEANPEVVEAEQNVVKARAGVALQKLAYGPVVAALGGFVYNGSTLPLLPNDFTYIGVLGTYNLFDFGKREHAVKGAKVQAEMAGIALQMTKAKVAGAIRASALQLETLRLRSELAHRLASAIQMQKASQVENGAEIAAEKKAEIDAEMFQADLDYRDALGKFKTLIGEK